MSILNGDSQLSNISMVSVKIDVKHLDQSGFFKQGRNNWIDEEKQLDANDIPEAYNYVDQLMNYEGVSEIVSYHPENPQEIPVKEKDDTLPVKQSASQSNEEDVEKKQIKNETKNIPKNYGKAIITFIEKYKEVVQEVTKFYGVDYTQFIDELRDWKKSINTIADLRSLWVDYRHAKCMRVLSNLFLRKYAFQYIFNSRICNYSSHIKYRHRMREALEHPQSFRHIKEY